MPLEAIASAVSRTTFSFSPLQAYLFQLFQPIGGVLARPFSSARPAIGASANSITTSDPRMTERFIRMQVRLSTRNQRRFLRRDDSELNIHARSSVFHYEKLHRV